jgi:hypothetical protein
MKTTLTLTTIGSRGVQMAVAPSALTEAGVGGVQIELGLHDGPLILTLTRQEAEALAGALREGRPRPARTGLGSEAFRP